MIYSSQESLPFIYLLVLHVHAHMYANAMSLLFFGGESSSRDAGLCPNHANNTAIIQQVFMPELMTILFKVNRHLHMDLLLLHLCDSRTKGAPTTRLHRQRHKLPSLVTTTPPKTKEADRQSRICTMLHFLHISTSTNYWAAARNGWRF